MGKWGREAGDYRIKYEITISESGELLSGYKRIAGGVKYSFKMCGHNFPH